ncbi:complement regulator-acquiring protein [Borreliella garinii]|uniref:complement regulator-acquiring protein n=1 Tax=Borreliella garinii TaxID=29519 RepID=UPI00292FF210|nr:complement regulator-acquiring protein [Borreliella garinii]
MKKTKLNIIKVNILTTILTLICISCAVNKIDPESKSKTNTKDFENKSQDLEPSNTKNKDLEPLEKNSKKTIISKLEKMIKNLEDQKDTEIAKITNTQIDILRNF